MGSLTLPPLHDTAESMASDDAGTRILRDGEIATQRVRVYRLRITSPHDTQTKEIAQPVLRFGSHSGNDIVIEDDAVSRIHFEICAEDRGFRLRDLGSTNGTMVDHWQVGDIFLRPSARIQVGQTDIRFEILDTEAELPLSKEDRFGPLVGKSPGMRELFATLQKVSPTDCTVLIEGESGTGKELVAEAIHSASARAGGPFVVFDCSAIASSLLESELFGHQKGSFTGAMSERIGCLEQADGGTLFLDEIGELSLDLQPKLLRAVERREIRRVGSNTRRQVDVRIIAATNRDLAGEVNDGGFRDDLYYRLAVVRQKLPPLRERTEDIPILVEALLHQLLRNNPAGVREAMSSITDEQWQNLAQYPWRGNVRELRNLIERRIALGDQQLPDAVTAPADPASDAAEQLACAVDLERPFFEQRDELLARFERMYLRGVLDRNNGNYSRAAAVARIDRMYFKRLLKKHPD